jgi:hypothetical protein
MLKKQFENLSVCYNSRMERDKAADIARDYTVLALGKLALDPVYEPIAQPFKNAILESRLEVVAHDWHNLPLLFDFQLSEKVGNSVWFRPALTCNIHHLPKGSSSQDHNIGFGELIRTVHKARGLLQGKSYIDAMDIALNQQAMYLREIDAIPVIYDPRTDIDEKIFQLLGEGRFFTMADFNDFMLALNIREPRLSQFEKGLSQEQTNLLHQYRLTTFLKLREQYAEDLQLRMSNQSFLNNLTVMPIEKLKSGCASELAEMYFEDRQKLNDLIRELRSS